MLLSGSVDIRILEREIPLLSEGLSVTENSDKLCSAAALLMKNVSNVFIILVVLILEIFRLRSIIVTY